MVCMNHESVSGAVDTTSSKRWAGAQRTSGPRAPQLGARGDRIPPLDEGRGIHRLSGYARRNGCTPETGGG